MDSKGAVLAVAGISVSTRWPRASQSKASPTASSQVATWHRSSTAAARRAAAVRAHTLHSGGGEGTGFLSIQQAGRCGRRLLAVRQEGKDIGDIRVGGAAAAHASLLSWPSAIDTISSTASTCSCHGSWWKAGTSTTSCVGLACALSAPLELQCQRQQARGSGSSRSPADGLSAKPVWSLAVCTHVLARRPASQHGSVHALPRSDRNGLLATPRAWSRPRRRRPTHRP